jgi:hypothetical protein
MKIINLGKADGLPPPNSSTTWLSTINEDGKGITAPFNAPSQGPRPWNVYRIEPRSATVVSAAEPGGLTRFRF